MKDGLVGTVVTLGHALRHAKGAVTGSEISGWDSCDNWDSGSTAGDTFYGG